MDSRPIGILHSAYVGGMLRRVGIVAAALALATALAACTAGASSPAPDATVASTHARSATATPGATSTPGAGAADAYLAYLDASAAIDTTNPATLNELLQLTTGTQLATDEKFFRGLMADDWRVEGRANAVLVQLAEASADDATLFACLDVANVHFFDSEGVERVPTRDATLQSLSVSMTAKDGTWLVSAITPREGPPPCVP